MRNRIIGGFAALAGFVGTVFGANWAINRFGVVPVGFGLMAPAAVYFAGAAFTLRDAVQRTLGTHAVLGAVTVGALASALVSPKLALASGTAFAVSELADFATFSALRARPALAVAASNTVGALIDSYIFLTIAFGSLAFFNGQVVGKLEMTVPVVALMVVAKAKTARRATVTA